MLEASCSQARAEVLSYMWLVEQSCSTRPGKDRREFRARATSEPIIQSQPPSKATGINYSISLLTALLASISSHSASRRKSCTYLFYMTTQKLLESAPPIRNQSKLSVLSSNALWKADSCCHGCLKAHVNRSRRSRHRELHHDWMMVNTRIRVKQVNIFASIFLVQPCISRVKEREICTGT